MEQFEMEALSGWEKVGWCNVRLLGVVVANEPTYFIDRNKKLFVPEDAPKAVPKATPKATPDIPEGAPAKGGTALDSGAPQGE